MDATASFVGVSFWGDGGGVGSSISDSASDGIGSMSCSDSKDGNLSEGFEGEFLLGELFCLALRLLRFWFGMVVI